MKNKILAEISISKETEIPIIYLIYNDLLSKCRFIQNLYPHNRGSLSTYDIIYNIFGFEDKVIGDIIQEGKDTIEESRDFFGGKISRDFFGRGEWPIIYWTRYRHRSPDIDDCVVYSISR